MKKLALKPTVKLNRNSKILDIGSGNNCLDISTHLIDLMPLSNEERDGNLETPLMKEFREGSIEAIPFQSHYFDFVHAAHVLEHASDPQKALSELVRVAHAGYIETPAASTEQGAIHGNKRDNKVGWDFHRWYVWAFPEMDQLYIKPKTVTNLFEYCSCRSGLAYARIVEITRFQDLDPVLPYHCKMTQFNWRGSISHEIWGEKQQGRGGPDCNCMYSAFFSHLKIYFRSFWQLRRRIEFKRKFPDAYGVVIKTLEERSFSNKYQ
ncbi:MAG: class I SAM-dependent methyltransferase [Bdellovibrionota bacterium]